MGNAGGRGADEESPLVGGRRAGGGGTGGSPLSSARAAWFSEAGAGGGPGQQHAQSYGGFVKGAGVGASLGTASSARGPGSSSSRSAEGSRRGLLALREHWPVLMEFLASFTLATVAFTSHAHPWALGLVLAGLAHAASTGTYYLQANPALTLAQLLRGHVALPRAAMVRNAWDGEGMPAGNGNGSGRPITRKHTYATTVLGRAAPGARHRHARALPDRPAHDPHAPRRPDAAHVVQGPALRPGPPPPRPL